MRQLAAKSLQNYLDAAQIMHRYAASFEIAQGVGSLELPVVALNFYFQVKNKTLRFRPSQLSVWGWNDKLQLSIWAWNDKLARLRRANLLFEGEMESCNLSFQPQTESWDGRNLKVLFLTWK